MQRQARLLFLALMVTVSSSLICAAQIRWHRIVDREAGFTVSFPGQPTYQESTAPETELPLETYSFYYNGNTLHVAFGPITPAPRTTVQVNKVLSDTAGVYARTAGNLLRQEKLPNGGRQFDNLMRTPSGLLHLRSRIYVRHGMMFTLSCGSYARDGIDERIAKQFFSSFNFTARSAKQQTAPRGNTRRKSPPEMVVRGRWHALRGPDGDFVVEFPGKPDYSIETNSGASTTLHQYRFAHGENFFSVSYRQRSELGTPHELELKQALKNYYAALPGWELLQQVNMPDGYLIEHRGMSTGHPILARTRLYLRGSRLYYVTSMIKNLSGPNKDDVNRFFSSFRLL